MVLDDPCGPKILANLMGLGGRCLRRTPAALPRRSECDPSPADPRHFKNPIDHSSLLVVVEADLVAKWSGEVSKTDLLEGPALQDESGRSAMGP